MKCQGHFRIMIRDPEKQHSQLHYHLSGNTAKPWMVEGTQPAHMLGTRRFLKAPCIVASKRCTLDFDTSFCNTFRPGLGTVTEKWPIVTLLKKYSRDTDVGVALRNAQQKSQMLIKQELLIRWCEDLQVRRVARGWVYLLSFLSLSLLVQCPYCDG